MMPGDRATLGFTAVLCVASSAARLAYGDLPFCIILAGLAVLAGHVAIGEGTP